MQILRVTARPGQAVVTTAADDPETARTAAKGVLTNSGRLPQLIEQAKEELRKTPNSSQIRQNLADYYAAARQNDKSSSELLKLAQLRPNDAGLQIQVGNQLARNRQFAQALIQYRAAFKKDPTLIPRSFSQIEALLLQTGQFKELIELMNEIDLRSLGSALNVGLMIQSLPETPALVEPIRSLFRKTWDTFPAQRKQLLVSVSRDDVWQMPEMVDLARDAIVAKAPTRTAPVITWYPFMPLAPRMSLTEPVTTTVFITAPVTRFLDLAAGQGRLEELASQVDAAQKTDPTWPLADAILALAHLRAGNFDEARSRTIKVFDHFQTDQADAAAAPSLYALWTMGRELEKHSMTRDLALTAYENARSIPFLLHTVERDGRTSLASAR